MPSHLPTSLDRARVVIARIIAEAYDRPSLVSKIACDIGAEILEGIRSPGEDLNSVELSRRYQTSRTPVREALMLLEKEVLVEVPPRRRPRVIRLGLPEIDDIYRVRAALLELVAAEVATKIDKAGVDLLDATLARMSEASRQRDLSAYIWANVEFHEQNTLLAGNRTAKRIIDSLLLRTLPLRRLSLSQTGRMQESLIDHTGLVRAYRSGDANLAAALIRSNHMNALATLQGCLRPPS